MKLHQPLIALLALLPAAVFSKEILSFDGTKLRRKEEPKVAAHLRSSKIDVNSGFPSGQKLMDTFLPKVGALAVKKLAVALCDDDLAKFAITIGDETYTCSFESAVMIANAVTGVLTEYLGEAGSASKDGSLEEEPIPFATAVLMVMISREEFKRDIHYLDTAARDEIGEMFLNTPIATWNYKMDDPNAPQRLGFIIEDIEPSFAVKDQIGDEVNLYGYISMATAAIQMQQDQIKKLQEQVKVLAGVEAVE